MLLHARGSLRALRQAFRPEACAAARSYISSATDDTSTAEVPAGHHGSDLSDVACNIALNRRRDLTLRQDLYLWQGDKKLSLADVLKGQRVLLVGLPDMGKVCADSHVPSYMDKLDDFKKEQIGLIAFMSMGSPPQVEEFASRFTFPPCMEVYADANGGVTRMLGLETGVPLSESGAKSQRFAGVVDDGILVRMCIEDSPADCSKSHAESVLDVVRTILW